MLAGFEKLVLHRHTSVAVGEFPHLLLKGVQGFRMPADVLPREGKPEELTVACFHHPDLGAVNNEFQSTLEI